jgi:hypothetical protein
MSDTNNMRNISNTSTQNILSKCLNSSVNGKCCVETNELGNYKSKTHFDTDKSLINIPKQMITKSNDLGIVNTYSISEPDRFNSSIAVESSKLDRTKLSIREAERSERHTEPEGPE